MALPLKTKSTLRILQYKKSQIINHKYQTNHNVQNSKFQTCFLFWSLNIGNWDLFVIWCLEFDIFNTPPLHYSSRPPDEGKTLKALWVSSKPGRLYLDSLLKALLFPGIRGVAVAPPLPVAGLILSCKLDSFKPFGALVKIEVWHQCSHWSTVGSG